MAVTKVIADILNLNEANTTKSFKMPTGSFFSGTPVEGMIRNDTSQSSQSSSSAMQYYNGTDWKNFVNLPGPYTIEYLAIAGGGGGGGQDANGGGGGGGAGG